MSIRHIDNMDGWCESRIEEVQEFPATMKIQIEVLSGRYYHNTVLQGPSVDRKYQVRNSCVDWSIKKRRLCIHEVDAGNKKGG